jgi:hypothetical protein
MLKEKKAIIVGLKAKNAKWYKDDKLGWELANTINSIISQGITLSLVLNLSIIRRRELML